MPPGHAPEELREPYVSAIRAQNTEALREVLNANPDYVWGKFLADLSQEEQTWLHYAWKDWQNSRMA